MPLLLFHFSCGSFAAFRQQVQRGTWEFYHAYGRQARFMGRGGELQISDSGTRGTQRFIAVDGRVEETPQFTATGMDPALVQLFPDGHRVVQRRLFYHDHVGTPFYDQFSQVLAADRTPPSVAG